MNKYDNLRKKLNESTDKVKSGTDKLTAVNAEMRRVANVAHNAEVIINDIDEQFARATKLNKTDITFLFVATALQCVRWILMPSLDLDFKQTPPSERLTSQQGAQIEKREQKSFLKDHEHDAIISSSMGFFGWNEIIGAPVPYDAMKGSEQFSILGDFSPEGKQLYGKNHHVATLGHDPLLGWVFGTMNIMTRTVTMKDFLSYNVEMYDRSLAEGSLITFNDKRQYIVTTPPTSLPIIVGECIASFAEDNKRLFAAVARQGMHLASDQLTKMGLPIPLLDAVKAQRLLEMGWNSVEAEKVIKKMGKNLAIIGAQAGLSILINFIVKSLHFLYFDGDVENQAELDLYEVKTRKILSYSNAIASGSNILYVALSRDIGKLDIGGIMVTIYRLISDRKFITSIKKEFLEKQWYDTVMGDFEEFDYLQEGKYE